MNIKETVSNLVIPNEWHNVIINSAVEPLSGGKSGMRIYKLITNKDKKAYVLKLADNLNGINELKYEVEILNELQDKEFAPKIYYTMFTHNIGLSLREYINGKPIDKCGLSVDEVVLICSHLMKQIHNINISRHLMKTYATRLEEAKSNVRTGLVDVEDFEDEFKGYSADNLYELFTELECVIDTDTFTHGDFNFPNIIYNGSEAKLIDWGSALMSDPYQDISLFIREFRDTVDFTDQKHLISIIEDTYGIDHIEDDKVRKFILLDEFF
jgi:aminoglycoside phosphotransferase